MRFAPPLIFAVTLAACTKPAPTPCHVDTAQGVSSVTWSAGHWSEVFSQAPGVKPEEQLPAIDEPVNGWIGSFAFSPDGNFALYANSLAGDFIPTSDGVSLVRIDLRDPVDHHPAVVELPGEALRNYAFVSWSKPGIAWASWSAFGIAEPQIPRVTVLGKIPKSGKARPTFPLYSSAAYAPGGDCVAVVLDGADQSRDIQVWKAAGASGPSHHAKAEERETILGWEAEGLLLWKAPPIVSSTSLNVGMSSARWVDPIGGSVKAAPAPPANAEAMARVGRTWVTVDGTGTVRAEGVTIAKLKATLEPRPILKQHHRWLRVFGSENGASLAVEEAIIGPRSEKRAIHLLRRTPGS